MARNSPSNHSPPRTGYKGRPRSPPRKGNVGAGGSCGRSQERNGGNLWVWNIPSDCRPEELRVPFERFGVVRDVYIPKDYHTGKPRRFAFVDFVDSCDASEAQHHMDRKMFSGKQISVEFACGTKKRGEEMMNQGSRVRGPSSGNGERRSSQYGRFRSCSISQSRSSQHPSGSRSRYRSRSSSRRHGHHPRRSPRGHPPERDGASSSAAAADDDAQTQNGSGFGNLGHE